MIATDLPSIDKDDELITLSKLATIKIGNGAVLHGLIKKTALASRWILGGALKYEMEIGSKRLREVLDGKV